MNRDQHIERACMDRIKYLLQEWAGWQVDGLGGGYPTQVSFATERVQTSNRSTETYREMPPDVARLNEEIERLPPNFKRIIGMEYCDRRPQKVKAAVMNIPRQVFSARLLWVHEQLTYAMWKV